MTYFLDFDRTIFNTPLFKKRLGTFWSFERSVMDTLDLRKFLYPEVEDFLRKNGKDCVIVTYGIRALFIAKVTDALTDFPSIRIVYTARRKGPIIRKLCTELPGPYTYVDDAHFQLRSVSRWCPNIKIYEIRRDDKPPAGQWPVIHSLTELPG